MTLTELQRIYKILKVQVEYGLDELLPNNKLAKAFGVGVKCAFWIKNKHPEKDLGQRLRLAFQELGPVWIKLGQMMSTRRDLFPDYIADPLAMLQDQVSPFDGKQAKAQIELSLSGKVEEWFDDFDITPLASASIAQVHTATARATGQQVVLKVIRPDIKPIIDVDLKLMHRLANFIAVFIPEARRLRPQEVVDEYEKTLVNELDLLHESANTMQLKRNFQDSPDLYIPEVLGDFSSKTLMVSERIYGIQVSDIKALEANSTDMKLLAEKGVTLFFTQVFRDSFFHADMHPGNVFVSWDTPNDPMWIGIDCGIVGTLTNADKRYLAENFLAFFNRDYKRVAELHVDSGWVPSDTNIIDFESAIRTVCEPIFAKPLGEISFGHVLMNLFNTARQFNMEVQPQLVLLQKTLLYIEGLGRQLYPQLDLWETAKPFLERWMIEQVGPKAMLKNMKERAPQWVEKMPELPELLYDSLKRSRDMDTKINIMFQQYSKNKRNQTKGHFLLSIGATLMVSASVLQLSSQDMHNDLSLIGYSIGALFWVFSWLSYRKS